MTKRVVVPQDIAAEGTVARSAIVYPEVLPVIAAEVRPSDFSERYFRSVIKVAASLPERCELPPMPLDDTSWLGEWWVPYNAREIAAVNAGLTVGLIDALRDFNATTNLAPYVRRLHDATQRRDAMRRLADAYNMLGAGASIDDIRGLIDGLAA